jgi:hypothetical protein
LFYGDICTSANIGFSHDEYSRIFVGGLYSRSGPYICSVHQPYFKYFTHREDFCHVKLNVRSSYGVYLRLSGPMEQEYMSYTREYRVFASIHTHFDCEYSRITNIPIVTNTCDYSKIIREYLCSKTNTIMRMGFPVTANIYSFHTLQRNNSREGVIKDVCHPRYRTLGCVVIYIRKYVGKDLLMIVIFFMYLELSGPAK